ncbi:hypothetical protein C8Q74DRAFT_1365079 [Fomes fomentarius]|nr:hypothetical protein C8Q74DRAFT_1365079 [Fomes fomentarius]
MEVNAGHKTRLNILERKMQENARVLNQLDARHYHLRNTDDPDYMAWIKEFQDCPLETLVAAIPDDSGGHANVTVERFPGVDTDPATAVVVPVDESEDDDPIDIALRNTCRGHLRCYRWLTASSFEDFMSDIIPPEELHKADPGFVRAMEIKWTARVQYYHRLVLHDPVLANKAEGKTSFLDLLHSLDFTLEDFDCLFGGVSLMGDALIWWKDSFLDAFDIWPSTKKCRNGASVVPDIQGNRVRFLGQWVYLRRHKKALTTEGFHDGFKNIMQLFVEDENGNAVEGTEAKEIRETLWSLLHSLVWTGQAAATYNTLSYEVEVYIHVMLSRHWPLLLFCEYGTWKINLLIKQMLSGFASTHIKTEGSDNDSEAMPKSSKKHRHTGTTPLHQDLPNSLRSLRWDLRSPKKS